MYSQKLNYLTYESLINTLELSEYALKTGDYEKTGKYVDEINQYPKGIINNKPKLEIRILILNGDLNRVTGFLDTSFYYYQKALMISQKNHFIKEEILINIKLCEFYRLYGVYDKANYHIIEAEKLSKELTHLNDSLMAYLYNRYAALPTSVDSSIFFTNKSNYYAKKSGTKEIIASNLNNLGMLYRYKGVDTAYKYFSEAVLIWRELNMKQDLLNTLVNITALYYDTQNYKKAIENADILYKEIGKIENTYAFEVYCKLKQLSFYQLGCFDSAYYYQKLMYECIVNRASENQNIKINNLVAKIELENKKQILEKKEYELKHFKKNKNLLLIIDILSSVFIVVFIFLLIKIYNSKKIVTKQKIELDILYKEVHHRVKNNLAIIIGILEMQIDNAPSTEIKTALFNASSRINSMSLIHDLIHKNYYAVQISALEYIEHLINYISNFQSDNKKIQTEIVCSKELMLNLQTAVPIGIIINELILNSIKHAKTKENKIVCNISLAKDGKDLFLNYSDNGYKNIKTTISSKSKGIGLYLIETMTKQLEGQMVINFETGFSSEFSFKIQQ